MSSVEERLTHIETTIAHYNETQQESTRALLKVGEAINDIQLSIERQAIALNQIDELKDAMRDTDARLSKVEARVYQVSGGLALIIFAVTNMDKIKNFIS